MHSKKKICLSNRFSIAPLDDSYISIQMNAANLLIKVRCFAVYSKAYRSILSRHSTSKLQMCVEDDSILCRPRNFFVIIDVYMYETMNIPRAH
jgi:hypothetical protein